MCKECNCYNGPPMKQRQYVKDTGKPHLDEEIIFSLLLVSKSLGIGELEIKAKLFVTGLSGTA